TGITVATLGQHVRAATYGAEARRVTRNREDVKIMVRYPQTFREQIANLESMWIPAATTSIPTTAGEPVDRRAWVPLGEVAELDEAVGYTTLHRADQQRAITVLGEVDAAITSGSDVLSKVQAEFIPALQERYPDMRVEFLGSAEE